MRDDRSLTSLLRRLARVRVDERGIGLPELLVSMALAVVIFGAVLGVFTSYLKAHQRADRRNDAENAARVAMDRLSSRARNATAPTGTATDPVERHTATDLILLAPTPGANLTNNAQGLVHFRFCLDSSTLTNEKLWRQTVDYNSATQTAPPADTTCPGASWPNQTIVASNLMNQAVTPTVPFFNTPTDSSGRVTDIGVKPVVDVDPNAGAPPTTLQTSVALRNLNHAPTAAISCIVPSAGHVSCDASGSDDVDGQTLSFSWKEDSTTLTETSYRIDRNAVASGAHTYAVTVTDSGGLSSTATQSVTVP